MDNISVLLVVCLKLREHNLNIEKHLITSDDNPLLASIGESWIGEKNKQYTSFYLNFILHLGVSFFLANPVVFICSF